MGNVREKHRSTNGFSFLRFDTTEWYKISIFMFYNLNVVCFFTCELLVRSNPNSLYPQQTAPTSSNKKWPLAGLHTPQLPNPATTPWNPGVSAPCSGVATWPTRHGVHIIRVFYGWLYFSCKIDWPAQARFAHKADKEWMSTTLGWYQTMPKHTWLWMDWMYSNGVCPKRYGSGYLYIW